LLELKLWVGKTPAADPKTPFAPSATLESGPTVTAEARPERVRPKKAFALTETTYVVPVERPSGVESACSCQPDAVSDEKATVASLVPFDD